MSLSSRTILRSAYALLAPFSLLFTAQPTSAQFTQPKVEVTSGEVVSFSVGDTQLQGRDDILYVEKPTVANTVNVGLLLNTGSGFSNLPQNQYTFRNVTGVVSAIADMDGDGIPDYVFATSPAAAGGAELCVFFGTKAGATSGAYAKEKSGCAALHLPGSRVPVFASVAAAGYTTGARPQLYLTDGANNALYVVSNAGNAGDGTSLAGYSLAATYSLGADGAGPMVTGDFNRDGKTDLIVNGQAGNTAAVYLGKGDGTFAAPAHYGQTVHSMLVQDVDGDGAPDLIAEGDQGLIQIYKGYADGTFDSASEGGSAAAEATSGRTLAAIDPHTLDILTVTPAGLSVLTKQAGTLQYTLAGIYNIGPGRSTFALADFFNTGALDLAAGSAEGVAIVSPDGQGGFQTSRAFATAGPASSVAVAKFRGGASPDDIAVAIGAGQSELLVNNGDGTFTDSTNAALASGASLPVRGGARIQAGNFAGDGVPGLLYSGAGASVDGSKITVQPHALNTTTDSPAVPLAGVRANASTPGNTVVADLNGDGIDDIAVTDASDTQFLIGQAGGTFRTGFSVPSGNNSPGQIAAGFFKAGRTAKQDFVVQQGASIVPYVNSGDGEHFTSMQPLAGTPEASALVPAAIRMADLDGDGNGDVMVLYRTLAAPTGADPKSAPNQVYVWFGNGDGTFGQPEMVSLSRQFSLAAIGDMNGDGRDDIVLADDSVVSILYNQGGRIFRSDFGTACSACAEQHLLAGANISDIALADVNGDGTADLIVANGGAAGAHPVAQTRLATSSATAQPKLGGGITVLPRLGTAVLGGNITVNPEPSAVGGAFTITLQLTAPSGSPVPTGTVQFNINGQAIGTANVTADSASPPNGTAFLTVSSSSSTPAGTYTITANYSGDNTYAANTFTGSHAVGSNTTTTTLLLCVAPTATCPASGTFTQLPPYQPSLNIVYGQQINGVAPVSKNDSNPLTGTISFLANGQVTCSYQVFVGQCATFPYANLQAGQYTLVAQYGNDPAHTGSSSTVLLNVAPDTTTTTLTGGPNPAVQGTPVTFTITVTGQYAAPTGTFTFSNGGNSLGTATLTPSGPTTSTATFTTSSLPVGTDQISADYGGNQNFLPSKSASFAEVITAPGTPSFKLTLAPPSLRVGVGNTGTLAVTITSVNGFSAPVNLSCGALPREATCTFGSATINGAGTTSLFVSTTAPHDCNNSQPYFIGSNGGPAFRSLALPALAGVFALFLPGRRKWIRSLFMLLLAAGAMSISGCGNCTDLATRPGTYHFNVNATVSGGSGQSQTVTLTVFI
jgi:hypothetical protein